MKFSNIFAFGLATLAIATPVEKRSSTADLTSGLDSTASEIITTVESLVSTLITDVEAIASAAGVSSSDLLGGAGLNIKKREASEGFEARSDSAIESAVSTLITDVLGELVTLGSASGVSLLSSLLSVLNL